MIVPDAADDVVVETRDLTRIYHTGAADVVALDKLNIEINRGDFIAVMGPSGSGKSTLMHILGLLDQPTEGSYRLLGQDTSTFGDRELSRLRGETIGFVFQHFSLIDELDIQENVSLPFLYQHRLPERLVRERAADVLRQVGLEHRLHHRPAQLSGGEMQRVAIARALVTNPVLLLADEPTGNLDRTTGESIIAALQALNDAGITVLIVTHSDFVAEFARRRFWMVDGRLHD